jgi:hypothetical protein
MPSTSTSSKLAGVTVDPRERELLAELLGVAVVRLMSIERSKRNASSKRMEVTALGANAVLGPVDDARVKLVAQQHTDCLGSCLTC